MDLTTTRMTADRLTTTRALDPAPTLLPAGTFATASRTHSCAPKQTEVSFVQGIKKTTQKGIEDLDLEG